MDSNPRFVLLGGDIMEDRNVSRVVTVEERGKLNDFVRELNAIGERLKNSAGNGDVLVLDSLADNHERRMPPDIDPEAVQILGDFHAGLERKRYAERLDQMLAAARSESLRVDRNRRKQRSRKRRGK